MSREFKWEYIRRQQKFYRVFAFLIIASLIISRTCNLIQNTKLMVYYGAVMVVALVLDQIFAVFAKHENFNGKTYKIKCMLFFILFAIGGVFGKLTLPLLLLYVAYGILIICEDLIMDDMFDSYKGYTFTIIYIVLLGAGVIIPYIKKEIQSADIVIYGAMIIGIGLAVILVRRISVLVATSWNEKYNDVYYKSQDVKKENDKLLELQERIEEVNNAINYQKVQLSETNSALEKKNIEIHSLMDVMISYTSSFDVDTDIRSMIKSIKEVKSASLVAMYIEKDVCFNVEPIFEFDSNENYAPNVIRKDTVEALNIFRKKGSREPLVIAENYTHNRSIFERKGCCIAAFPAYENDTLYGVLVVAGDKYDFFFSGFDYYRSAVVDFTAALISDRLYLTMEDMAKRDGLTKIYNRIHFNHFYDEMLAKIKRDGGTISVLMADIDHFKKVNDTFGHLAGDEAIKALAKLDEAIAKKYGCEAVRFGGEEFLLIMNGKSLDEAYKIAEEFHKDIREKVIDFEGKEIRINTSMGVANYPETVDDLQKVLDRADKAMYYGKTHGRGRIVIDGRWDPEDMDK